MAMTVGKCGYHGGVRRTCRCRGSDHGHAQAQRAHHVRAAAAVAVAVSPLHWAKQQCRALMEHDETARRAAAAQRSNGPDTATCGSGIQQRGGRTSARPGDGRGATTGVVTMAMGQNRQQP
jgi:hypothetical protein